MYCSGESQYGSSQYNDDDDDDDGTNSGISCCGKSHCYKACIAVGKASMGAPSIMMMMMMEQTVESAAVTSALCEFLMYVVLFCSVSCRLKIITSVLLSVGWNINPCSSLCFCDCFAIFMFLPISSPLSDISFAVSCNVV